MARKKKTAAPEPDLEIRADPEVIAEELEPIKPERSHTELMMLRGLGLLPPGEDFIPTSLFVSNNVLTSGMGGDLEADIDASGIASFNIPGKAFTNIEELIVDITAVQDLHGYDNPWPAGGGKNLLKFPFQGAENNPVTKNGITFTDNGDGSITLDGTSTGPGNTYYNLSDRNKTGSYVLVGSSFVVSVFGSVNGLLINYFYNDNSTQTTRGLDPDGNLFIYNVDDVRQVTLAVQAGKSFNNVKIWPQVTAGSVAPTAYSPYSNICPITGWSEAKIYVQQTVDPTANPTAAIQIGQTVYGGTLDVTRGKLTVTHGNIASYAGETINEPWLSSMDVYAPGQTPTTGAQVVYTLTTPIDVDLAPANINALLGDNNIWAECGPVTKLEYSYDLLINQY